MNAESSSLLHGFSIANDLYIAPMHEKDHDKSMMCLNHSCSPNIGMRGDIVFIAMRDINSGEELTIDYAMMDNASTTFQCVCGTEECRKEITGSDWENKEIQDKYKGYFSAYIASLFLYK